MFFFTSVEEYLCTKKDMDFISYAVYRTDKEQKIEEKTFLNLWNTAYYKISEKDIFISIKNEQKQILNLSTEILYTLRTL